MPAGGWHRCRRRRRHRACLDGANKIRPNFTVQTAKQWGIDFISIPNGEKGGRGASTRWTEGLVESANDLNRGKKGRRGEERQIKQ